MTRFDRRRIFLFGLLVGLALALCSCGGAGTDAGSSGAPAAPQAAQSAPPPAPPSETVPSAPLGTSSVVGTVVFAGQVPRLKPISMNADPVCAGKHESAVPASSLLVGEGQTLGNVFVQIQNAPAGVFPPPAAPAVINQNGCLYEPHVLGVLAGQKVVFHNSDGVLHNVHGKPEINREFNIGMPPTVMESEVALAQPEPMFPVKCDVHPWMKAYVAVLSHPFFAVTGADGSFRIDGLPAGTYQVQAWHEKLGTQMAEVTVADGESGPVDFTFRVPTKG